MGELHLIGGEKGGVGKSVVARLLAQYWLDHAKPFISFDTDRSHGALLRYYSDFAHPIEISRVEDLDKLIEASAPPDARVLVDLAAQTERDLHAWIESGDVLDLVREQGIRLVLWHVMDDGKDSVSVLSRLLDRYGERANHVVVLNKGRGSDFSLFRESPAAQSVSRLAAPLLELPALHSGTMNKIDRLDKSFWSAVHQHNGPDSSLGMVERQRVRMWLRESYGQFERLGV
jgi:MinD-like ATPase involved in chromosome partitioning or flagellar assembly